MSSDARGRLDALKAELAAAKKALPEVSVPAHPGRHQGAARHASPPARRSLQSWANLFRAIFFPCSGTASLRPLQTGSGRLDLANQIASPTNPLTARVIVNRIWHHHFGAGLVRTLSNFGAAGDRPSHPELLDYLAVEFVENGWSIKKLHREILLSSAYAMSSQPSEQALAADPENRLLSRIQPPPR